MRFIAFFIILIVVGLFVIRPSPSAADSVILAWDANTEPDLAGYKIYYGAAPRATTALAAIEKWCAEHEPKNDKCVDEWMQICGDDNDRNCHAMLFSYDKVVDVGNVTEYELTGLVEGMTYHLAATAYDTDDNESAFSKELVHTPGYSKPKTASGFSHKPLRISW